MLFSLIKKFFSNKNKIYIDNHCDESPKVDFYKAAEHYGDMLFLESENCVVMKNDVVVEKSYFSADRSSLHIATYDIEKQNTTISHLKFQSQDESEYVSIDNKYFLNTSDPDTSFSNDQSNFYRKLERSLKIDYGRRNGRNKFKKYVKNVMYREGYEYQSRDIMDFLHIGCSKYNIDYLFSQHENLIKQIENFAIFVFLFAKATSFIERQIAVATLVKLHYGDSFTKRLTTDVIAIFYNIIRWLEDTRTKFNAQSLDFDNISFDKILNCLRNGFDKFDEICESTMYKKLYKLFMYALSFSLFEGVGIDMNTFNFSLLYQEAIKKKYYKGKDFYYTICETALFLCERGYQCFKTGRLDSLYHSGKSYTDWLDTATRLKQTVYQLEDPELYGLEESKFLAELADTLEKGSDIYKHATRVGSYEKKMIRDILSDLNLIQTNLLTTKRALESRDPPFSVLLYGDSSIGKTTITEILFQHFAKHQNLPADDRYKYTRNPAAKYWDNFKTYMWFVRLDDIAFMHPEKAPQGDPSVMEMLQVVNGVPFVPDQAALENKGKTALRCKLCIATSNSKDLNAYHYFNCPSAVQRRFPYIIQPFPKKEFRSEVNSLDSSKVDQSNLIEYPDYWEFNVYKVDPQPVSKQRAPAVQKLILDRVSLRELLVWYNTAIDAHNDNSDKISTSNCKIKHTILCDKCKLPKKTMCLCQTEQQSGDQIVSLTKDVVLGYILALASFAYIAFMRGYFSIQDFIYAITAKALNFHLRDRLYHLGEKMKRNIGEHPIITAFIAVLGTLPIAVFLFRYIFQNVLNQQSSSNDGFAPKSTVEERENVWYKNDYEVTSFDIDPLTHSYKGLHTEQIDNILIKNCLHGQIRRGNIVRNQKFVCLKGHVYICNNHFLDDLPQQFTLDLIKRSQSDGVNTNVSLNLSLDDFIRYPEYDIATIVIKDIPPCKDITRLFIQDEYNGRFDGHLIQIARTGAHHRINLKRCTRVKQYMQANNCELDLFSAFCTEPTRNGDCGSLLILDTQDGPIIGGIHGFGDSKQLCASLVVNQGMIDKFLKAYPSMLQIQDGVPMLSSQSVKRELTELHKKSPIRYIDNGTASVYGSFAGFRSKMSSKVEITPLAHDLCKDKNYKIAHGKPVMNSWEPWRIALLDSVQMKNNINNQILDVCVEDFTNDILRNLPKEELDLLHVYDNFTAVNGASGITYVDKINRNTSAGNPWKKGKKYYFEHIPVQQDMQDPIEFNDEIMERVDAILHRYKKGIRVKPNFCAHLKDEATKFSKIKMKKTRVFSGAPVDWSIVVRKYALSLIRVIQRNRFTFEAAPGTIAQSFEWHEIYEYLTKFGKDKIVAGDYAAFDKSMSAKIMYAAFQVMHNILATRYNEEELRVFDCIAVDTTFALTDFNGDLIQFHGSNPSGHPLTVIINSIANSLYMRYCYAVLSGTNSAKNFKKHVSLMTYGDDNIMGVSVDAPFFNHTDIVRALSEIGVKYTMADKEAQSVPYIHIDQASFLKRTWRFDSDVNAYLCPIEHASIEKMLMVWVRSRTISKKEQCIAILSSAHREYFFYGKQRFEDESRYIHNLINKLDLGLYYESSLFQSYSELRKQFWDSSKHIRGARQFIPADLLKPTLS